MEEHLVVQIRRDLGTAPAGRQQGAPAQGVDDPRDQLALDVALQKAALVFAEELFAVEPVRQGGEAAARYAGDQVHLVEEPHRAARAGDLDAPEHLEDTERERGGAHAAAGEREDDQILAGPRFVPSPSNRGAGVSWNREIGRLRARVARPLNSEDNTMASSTIRDPTTRRRNLRDQVAGQLPTQRRTDCWLIPSGPYDLTRRIRHTRTKCFTTPRRAARAFTSRIQIGAAILRPLDGSQAHARISTMPTHATERALRAVPHARQRRADPETQRR